MTASKRRSARRLGRVLARDGRREMANGMRGLLQTIDRGDLAAPAGLASRLEGGVLALDALNEEGAPPVTKAELLDTADLLRRLGELVDSGTLEASPAMARALEGAADTLAAVASLPGVRG